MQHGHGHGHGHGHVRVHVHVHVHVHELTPSGSEGDDHLLLTATTLQLYSLPPRRGASILATGVSLWPDMASSSK